MLDGHGFVAHITPLVRQHTAHSTQSSHSQQRAQADRGSASSDAAVPHQAGTNGHPGGEEEELYDFDQQTDTSLPDSLTQFEQWQGVQVYSLGRPVVHCFVRWGTYNVILMNWHIS